ncbi:MAG: DUF4386 domain-containing protein [Anaerolineae bacterium]|nr:DUF4386 domain-containing protein [Anaerolineae bacterium]
MNPKRNTAILVGALLILGTAAGILLGALLIPILQAPDYLIKIYANKNVVAAAIILQFTMAFACTGVGISLYPILKKHHEGFAIGAAAFRMMEGMNGIIVAICLASLLALSQEFGQAGAPASSQFHALGALLKSAYDWVNNVPMLLTWHIGALMYYAVFYKTMLLPRWLSVWGFLGIALSVVYCVLILFGIASSSDAVASGLNVPILLQEMVMAVWLIVKGFAPTLSSSSPVRRMVESY